MPEVLPATGAAEIQGTNFLLYSSSAQDGSTAPAATHGSVFNWASSEKIVVDGSLPSKFETTYFSFKAGYQRYHPLAPTEPLAAKQTGLVCPNFFFS